MQAATSSYPHNPNPEKTSVARGFSHRGPNIKNIMNLAQHMMLLDPFWSILLHTMGPQNLHF